MQETQESTFTRTAKLLHLRDTVSALRHSVAKDASRYAMNRIYLTPKGYWATDGKIGIHVPLEEGEEVSGSFLLPEFPNIKALPNLCHLTWTKESTQQDSLLARVQILSPEEGISLVFGVLEERFPGLEEILEEEKQRDRPIKAVLNLELLERLVKTLKPVAKRHTSKGFPLRVSIEIADELSAVLFELEDEKASGILMPLAERG